MNPAPIWILQAKPQKDTPWFEIERGYFQSREDAESWARALNRENADNLDEPVVRWVAVEVRPAVFM